MAESQAQTSMKSRKKKKRGMGIYMKNVLTRKVTLPFHLLGNNIVENIQDNLKSCKDCGNISDAEICEICINPSRKGDLICVVEDIRDILAIESTQQYFGKYHVLGGVISPMEGIGPNDLNVDSLLNRLNNGGVAEVILALNASMEGDTTNFYLFRKLADFDVKVTTLSRGVAVGTELQYADELTLGRSIINRLPFDMNLVRK